MVSLLEELVDSEALELSEEERQTHMTEELLETIINNSEFTACIEDAAPTQVRIIQDYKPQMKELQARYLEMMEEADYHGVQEIKQKLRLDKKDETAKIDYNSWKKKVMNEFKATMKALEIGSSADKVASVSTIYVAGRMLKYIGREEIINNALGDNSTTVSFKKLEDMSDYFKKEDTKTVLKDIFEQVEQCQQKIVQAQNSIKFDAYEKLPTELQFDPKTNKSGLKANNFCALVRHKAMGMIKDADGYTKYISQQVDNTNANIDREEIMLGKTRQM